MNSNHLLSLIILSCFLLLASCGSKTKSQNNNYEDDIHKMNQKLKGEWEWVLTECCFPEVEYQTPENCDCTASVIFDDHHAIFYKNGEIDREDTYEISFGESRKSTYKEGDFIFIVFDGFSFPAMLSVSEDSLIIDYSYMDLHKDVYVRPGH
jgi:hypothetical protein